MPEQTTTRKPTQNGKWILLFLASLIVIGVVLVVAAPKRQVVSAHMRSFCSYGCVPVFSPDGAWIAFCGRDPQAPQTATSAGGSAPPSGPTDQLYVVPASGGTPTPCCAAESLPAWIGDFTKADKPHHVSILTSSPSGAQIRYYDPQDPTHAWGVIDLSGTVREMSSTVDCASRSFVAESRGVLRVYYDTPRTGFKYIGRADEMSRPVWSPDGRYLAWNYARKISVYDRAAHKLTRIATPEGYPGFTISWHPTEPIFVNDMWSSDPTAAAPPTSFAGGMPGVRSGSVANAKDCVGIAVYDAAKGRSAVLYDSGQGGVTLAPTWHPSGKFIACVTQEDQPFLISAKDPFSGQNASRRRYDVRPVSPNEIYGHQYPGAGMWSVGATNICPPHLSWSPDGRLLAYGRDDCGIVTFELEVSEGTIEDLWK